MASPVHLCCASEKARVGRAESAVAAQAMAKRSAILFVRWKVIDASPKVARSAGRCSLGALHAVCTAARVIHHTGITRCGCSISADVRIKSAAPPCVNYEPMFRSCNGSRQHFLDCCARATSTEAQRQLGTDAALFPDRWIPKKCWSLRLSSSSAIEPPARRTLLQ